MSDPFRDEDGPQPPRLLSGAAEIHAYLRPLLDNRTPLHIRFDERSQRYRSFLVALDRAQGALALDELLPDSGTRLLLQGEPCQLEGVHDGARLAWDNRQAGRLDELDGAPCCWLPLPTTLVYHQRRNAYRAVLRQAPIAASLSSAPLCITLQGQLLDLSATGCRLSLRGDPSHALQPGQLFELSAQLPMGTLESAVELRHVHVDTAFGLTFCGLRFHRPDGLTRRQLERLVNQLQRDARRVPNASSRD